MVERKATMTDRQRVEALLSREKPDRIPIWPFGTGVATVYTGTSIADAYNKPKVSYEAQKKTARDFGWVFFPMMAYASYGSWEFGGDIKWPSGEFAQAPMVTRSPVETEDDVWKLKTPDVATAGFIPIMTDFYKIASQERLDNEPFNIMAMVGGPFSVAGVIAGPDKLCKWTLKKPDVAHHLIRLATDHMIDLAEYWHSLFGVEGVLPFTGEAVASNQLISAKTFEEFVLPYVQEAHNKLISLGYKHIFCHICGEQNDNLVHWAKVSYGDPGLISFGHEVDIVTAAECFPKDIIIGNVEPAIIQSGTPEEVYRATKVCIEKGKECPGGYMLAPGCEMPPLSPPDNIMAMTRAVNDFGWND
jgi:uroporphyrinogen decarboxylase